LKGKQNTKRHEQKKRSPAIVAVPEKVAALLKLVNLLPGCFRHPYWAVENRNFEQLPGATLINEIIEWRPNAPSEFAWLSAQLNKEAPPVWARRNTPQLLWQLLSSIIKQLPLLLQAFVLNDDFGKLIQMDMGEGGAKFVPMFGEHDFQIEENFRLLLLDDSGLEKVVRVSTGRVDLAFSDDQQPQPHYYNSPDIQIEDIRFAPTTNDLLIPRVRQRLIFLLAAQELISCLTHPDPHRQFMKCDVMPRSEAARPRPYIDKETGRFSLRTAILFFCLEGVEARRIRECQVCYQFFWAGRLDMKCCSAKCSHTLRSRKYRQAYKEKYAFQRYRKSLKDEKSKAKSERTSALTHQQGGSTARRQKQS
jgi:hypothetical protein